MGIAAFFSALLLFVITRSQEGDESAFGMPIAQKVVSIHPYRLGFRYPRWKFLREAQRNRVPGDLNLGMHHLSATSTQPYVLRFQLIPAGFIAEVEI